PAVGEPESSFLEQFPFRRSARLQPCLSKPKGLHYVSHYVETETALGIVDDGFPARSFGGLPVTGQSARCYSKRRKGIAPEYAHVLNEAIESRHDDATGEAWLHGCVTYMLYR